MKPRVLIIDNYDSFTYNLVHYVESIIHESVSVYRNDAISIDEVAQFDNIIISPGPGLPLQAGISLPLIKQYSSTKSILGVCLGMQAIIEAFGGKLKNLPEVYHGVSSEIQITDSGEKLFKGIPLRFEAGRYHSWVADPNSLPTELQTTSIDKNHNIMSVTHRQYNIRGVQFHPESVMTSYGKQLLKNWLLT